jgi:redox-sensitive bicupin YhaK (pirin superfamily)
MIEHRPFANLGRFENNWLSARYHFSFSGYHDPARMGWGALRVWNDDAIRPKSGFPPHSHADMEIITYVRQGAITHEDSLGNRGRTEAGDVQVMSAGAGVTHSEFNLESDTTRLYQIWILPRERGGAPYWGAAKFPRVDLAGALTPLASGFAEDQAEGALPLRQDARLLAANLPAGRSVRYRAQPTRHLYLAVASGACAVNGVDLTSRDGAAIRGEQEISISAHDASEIVLVDAP